MTRARGAALATALALHLAGCGNTTEPVTGQRAAEAARFVMREQAPNQVRGFRIWYASGDPKSMACGTFASPSAGITGSPRIRFVYDFSSSVHQIEYHQGWIPLDGNRTAIEANRSAFDGLWSQFCAPFEPKRFWFF